MRWIPALLSIVSVLATDPLTNQPTFGGKHLVVATNGYVTGLTFENSALTHTYRFTLDSAGGLAGRSDGSSTNQFYIDPSSGWTGTGTKTFFDDGKVYSAGLLSFTNVTITNVTTATDNLIFRIPDGKRAFANMAFFTTNISGTTLAQLKIKPSGGSYLTFLRNVTLTAGAQNDVADGSPAKFAFEPGDSLAINPNSNGLGVTATFAMFSTNLPVRTLRALPLSSGDNTVYTVPSGKRAIPISYAQFLGSPMAATRSLANLIFQNSGPDITYNVYVNNGLLATRVQTSGINSVPLLSLTSLNSGDVLKINSSSADGTQVFFISVFEVDYP